MRAPKPAMAEGDWVVFGELAFADGEEIDLWCGELGEKLVTLLEFDQHLDEELLRLDFAPGRVRLRAWLLGASFQSWAPRLEAMFAAAARHGATGEVIFAGSGRAHRLHIDKKRVHFGRTTLPPDDHPALIEIADAVEERAASLLAAREHAAARRAAAEAEIAESRKVAVAPSRERSRA
jgi:hypothetical protein